MSGAGLLHEPNSGTTRRVTLAYSPGLPPTLRVEETAGASYDIPIADLSVSRGGWQGDAVTIAWQREGQSWAVTVDSPQTIAELAKQLPPHLSGPIQTWQQQSKRGARWSTTAMTIGVLVTLLPLFLLIALLLMRDRIVDIIIEKIPTNIDVEIGDRMYQRLVASNKLVKDGPSIEAMRALSGRLTPHLPGDFPFRFEVVNDSSVNAFAAPGGLVVVHTGLLAKATSADQVAGVLSHEIIHVTRRHSMRQIVYNLGLTTTVYWSLGIPDGASATLVGSAIELSDLKFGRDQESDADIAGLALLEKARLPTSGLLEFLAMLSQDPAATAAPAFLSTHPADKDRLAALEKIAAERTTPNVEPLSIDWSSVRSDANARQRNP